MKTSGDDFAKRSSQSVLIVYLVAIFLLLVISFFDRSIDIDRVSTAICIGGTLIAAGDLLRSPFNTSDSLRRTYGDFYIACEVLTKIANVNNHFINGERASVWLNAKMAEAKKKFIEFETNTKAEFSIFVIGIALSILGFSTLFMILVSDKFFEVVSANAYVAIIAFIFLLVSLLIKEYGDYILEKVFKDNEEVRKITRVQLSYESFTETSGKIDSDDA